MSNDSYAAGEAALLMLIVSDHKGSEVLRVGRKNGCSGGTVHYGTGTIHHSRLKFFGLDTIRKEIVLMVMSAQKAKEMLTVFNDHFHFDRPHHGIAFSFLLSDVFGTRKSPFSSEPLGKEENTMYQAIYTIVDRGKAEHVIDAAVAAGSKGGTIIKGRGSGIHETRKVFNMEIEPEKEIVLILAETHTSEAIISSIREQLEIDKPGRGILFTMDVKDAIGLY